MRLAGLAMGLVWLYGAVLVLERVAGVAVSMIGQ